MPERINPKSPEFAEMDAHMHMYNLLVNPQVFFDQGYLNELPEAEREVLKGVIRQRMQDVIDE